VHPKENFASTLKSRSGHLFARGEGRWGAASSARGWSRDSEAAYRLVCYGYAVQILHDALEVRLPHTVNLGLLGGVRGIGQP
jgi:hypothetical protein